MLCARMTSLPRGRCSGVPSKPAADAKDGDPVAHVPPPCPGPRLRDHPGDLVARSDGEPTRRGGVMDRPLVGAADPSRRRLDAHLARPGPALPHRDDPHRGLGHLRGPVATGKAWLMAW